MPLSTPIQSGGTFTPTVTFGGASVGMTYAIQLGQYTRAGDRIFFNLTVMVSALGSSTGAMQIAGLPVATNSTTNHFPVFACNPTGMAAGLTSPIIPNAGTGQTTINMSKFAAGTTTSMTQTDCAAGMIISVSGQYTV